MCEILGKNRITGVTYLLAAIYPVFSPNLQSPAFLTCF